MGEAIFSKSYAGDALSNWEIAHELSKSVDSDALVVCDSIRYDWHLLRLHDPAFLYRKVRMRCVVKFLPTTTTSFYIHHYGGQDIAEIASDGTIVNRGVGTDLSANALANGAFEIDATFLSRHGHSR